MSLNTYVAGLVKFMITTLAGYDSGYFWQGLFSFWFSSEWLNMICLLTYNYDV